MQKRGFTLIESCGLREGEPKGSALIELPAMRERGFTLIELLVVIAIISLLVSILLPSLQRAKDLAARVVCMTNQRALRLGVILYTEEAEGWLPQEHHPNGNQRPRFVLSNGWDPPNISGYLGWVAGVADQIWPQVASEQAYFCPADKTTGQEGDIPGRIKYSYAWNVHLFRGPDYAPTPSANHFYRHMKLDGARGESAMLGDRNVYGIGPAFSSAFYQTTLDVGWFHDRPYSPHEPGYRHLEQANIAFIDGSIASMDRGDIIAAGDDFWYPGN